jgi:hypothetical protein
MLKTRVFGLSGSNGIAVMGRGKGLRRFAPITVRSRGELGVLSSLNQRVWLQYLELREFLSSFETPQR